MRPTTPVLATTLRDIILLLTFAAAAAAPAPALAQHGGQGRAAKPAPPAPPSEEARRLTVAVVNGEPITLADLQESFGQRHSGHGGLLAGGEIIREIVDKAVEEKLLVQEGRRMGIADEPAFRKELEIYRDLQMLEALEEVAINKAAEPSPAEVKAAYDLLPRQIHLLVIETRDRAKAGEVFGRVRIGEDFEGVARQLSVHRSRTRGGDMGWVTWGTLDAATEEAALRAPVGQVGGPIAVDDGFLVFKVIEERKGTPPELAKVQDQIRAILAGRAKERKRAELLASIRRAHPPTEDAAAVRKLLAADPADSKSPADPLDEAVLMKTATGLSVAAGYVRGRAAESHLTLAAAWESSRDDSLLIDEARRRLSNDPEIRRSVKLHTEELIRREVERSAVLKDIQIGDADVRAFYDKDPNAFAPPTSYRMRHIVLATQPEAEEVRRQLLAGADFASLAKERSIDASTAGAGGELGWNPGPLSASGPAVERGILALKAGESSDVMHTTQGWAVVQMVEKRAGAAPPFESVKDEVAKRLIITRQRALRESFVAKLRKVSVITVDQKAVARAIEVQDEIASKKLTPAPAAPRKG
ncbi:MAG: peptidyl-prolyl cis-trans isomerase [Acidobacteria bacterium]|nr:peptidyl-prolyl cis-trans isomerase [Acidobacteriota bacterium]